MGVSFNNIRGEILNEYAVTMSAPMVTRKIIKESFILLHNMIYLQPATGD
jgi:hypothetical protein